MKNVITISLFIFLYLNILAQSKKEEINMLILSQKYSEALNLSNELVSNYPDSAYYHYQKSIINKLMYRYPQALNSIQNALSLNSGNIDYLEEYGVLLAKKDKEKEAVDIFKDVLKKDPKRIYSGIWLSNYYMKEREYKEAKDILLKLYNNDSTNSYFARNIGLCNIKLIDKVGSIKWLLKATELDSTDIKAYEYLALVYVSLEKFDLALENLNKALLVDPNNKELYVKIGDTHIMRNHNYQAIPVFLKAYELDTKDESIAKKIGICYFKIKKNDKAKEYLDRTINLGVNDLQVYEYLGYIHADMNQLDSSNYYFNEALKLIKPDSETIFSLKESIAKNYYTKGDFVKAINIYNEMLGMHLTDVYWITYRKNKVIIEIASIYQDKLDNKLKAIEYYEKVVEPEITINKNYYEYAQSQISKLKEELFFEGKL